MNPEAAQKPCGALGSRGGKEPIRRGALHDAAVIEEQHILGDAGGKLHMVSNQEYRDGAHIISFEGVYVLRSRPAVPR